MVRTFDEVVSELIDERLANGTDSSRDLLDLLLTVTGDDGETMGRDHVRDELITMMLAGHETTANVLSWLWYLLTQNPVAYQRHLDEVDAVLGATVSPSQRTSTASPGPEPACRRPCASTRPHGSSSARPWSTLRSTASAVPRKTTVIFLVHLIHRDRRWWDDPEHVPTRTVPPKFGTSRPWHLSPIRSRTTHLCRSQLRVNLKAPSSQP